MPLISDVLPCLIVVNKKGALTLVQVEDEALASGLDLVCLLHMVNAHLDLHFVRQEGGYLI